MRFDSIFGRTNLGDTGAGKTRLELAAALRRLTPLLAFYHTLGYGMGRVCLKNCGGVSQDLTTALLLEGFDVRVVGHPGHFTCGVNVEEIGVDIDLSHLQFDPEVFRIHSSSDNPEEEVHDFFLARIWENPYLIGLITIRQPFYSEPQKLSFDRGPEMVEQLNQTVKEIQRYPDFGARADAQTMLEPLAG